MTLYGKHVEKLNLTLELDDLIKSKGGLILSPENRGTHPHWLYIELDNGNFVGYWFFHNLGDICSLLGDSNFIKLIANFSDKEYLISVHPNDINKDE